MRTSSAILMMICVGRGVQLYDEDVAGLAWKHGSDVLIRCRGGV